MDWPVLGLWVGMAVPLTSYVVYPLGLIALARVLPASPPTAGLPWPDVTVAIAAHNEEASIERAVRSILTQEYPGPEVRVLVGLDGCTDRTRAVLEGLHQPRVAFLDLARGGKASTDNHLVAAALTEVVVTTSAGAEFAADTLARLVSPLRDPAVGAATGVFLPRPGGTGAAGGEGLYWRFENAVMEAESRFGILAMASGTALAFRRELFEPIPADSDADVVIAPTMTVHGRRVVHVPDAVVFDDGPATYRAVLRNRRRMALRALPATVQLVPRLVAAGRIGPALGLLAHKLCRWLTPVAAGVWLASAAALMARRDPTYVPLVTIVGGLGLAGGMAGLASARTRGAVASLAVAQAAFGLAVLDVLRGRRARTWTREGH